MMRIYFVVDCGDFYVDYLDLVVVCFWMLKVCGLYWFEVVSLGLVQFEYYGNVLKLMCIIFGYIGYGIDVIIIVEDVVVFNVYSLSLLFSGEQELCWGGLCLFFDVCCGVIIVFNECQELSIVGDCCKLQVVIGCMVMCKVLEEMLQWLIDMFLCFDLEMDVLDGVFVFWWCIVWYISEEMVCSEFYVQVFFSSDLECVLIKGLILVQLNNYSEVLQQGFGGCLLYYLLCVCEFFQVNVCEILSLEDVECVVGVLWFKLFEGFCCYFGVLLMSYLKYYWFVVVCEEIFVSGGVCSILMIVLGWGFSYFGCFFVDYCKCFEEILSMIQCCVVWCF